MKPRIQWEHIDEEHDCKVVLHTDHTFPANQQFMFMDKPLDEAEHEKFRQLVDLFKNIHGVTSIGTWQYSLTVGKGMVFSWSEIKPRVLACFREFAGFYHDQEFNELPTLYKHTPCECYGDNGMQRVTVRPYKTHNNDNQ